MKPSSAVLLLLSVFLAGGCGATIRALSYVQPGPAPTGYSDQTYVVQRGDTLWGIAQKTLGDGRRWREIIAANPGLNPREMVVGQALHIPGRSAPPQEATASPPQPTYVPFGPVQQRWAVVIGISDYAKAGEKMPKLQFANRDAEKFAEFLKSEAGGSFPESQVKLLTDQVATKEAITDALFEFLKRTVKEDLVVIYFSGHGLADPDKPSNLYLMAYDSDPARIASTGFPMWDLDTALKRTIAAERVVVLADACHSAGVTEGIKGVKVGEQFNSYFEELAKTRPGRVILTSCEGYEVSREGEKWGGGHGVFTWALLEGLKGAADTDRNGIVTLGEVLDYVDITVRRETANEQHPTKAGVQFDRNLPMGVVK